MRRLYAGLDVADDTTAICVVDESGNVCLETTSETCPHAILAALKPCRRRLKAIGYETGRRAALLHYGLEIKNVELVCLDARSAHSVLGARLNKTDRNDANGLANLLASGLYQGVHVKSREAIRILSLLGLRKSLVAKARSLKVAHTDFGRQTAVLKDRRRMGYSEAEKSFHKASESVSRCLEHLEDERKRLDRIVAEVARESPVCQRLMTVPGVGPITALTFVATIDTPTRFESSRDVSAYLGLTPRTFQSGAITKRSKSISKWGDRDARGALFIAARSLMNSRKPSPLRDWAQRKAKEKGFARAYVACARKLAALMHRMWLTQTDYDPKHHSAKVYAKAARRKGSQPANEPAFQEDEEARIRGHKHASGIGPSSIR